MDFDIIILAGGKGSRMGFKDKGLLEFRGKTLVENIISITQKLANINQKVIISCNQNLDVYQQYGEVVADELPDFCGPLAGMSSALSKTNTEYALILAVDTPYIDTQSIEKLSKNMDENTDICVAFDGKHMHPTTMFLRTNLKNNMDNFLNSGERKLGKWIREQRFKQVNIDTKILTNLNYPKDLITSL